MVTARRQGPHLLFPFGAHPCETEAELDNALSIVPAQTDTIQYIRSGFQRKKENHGMNDKVEKTVQQCKAHKTSIGLCLRSK